MAGRSCCGRCGIDNEGIGVSVSYKPTIDGQILVYDLDTNTASWEVLSLPAQQAMLTFSGVCTVVFNPLQIHNVTGTNRTISKIFLAIDTAPTGSALIVDILKNGVSIFGANPLPQIDAGLNTGFVTLIGSPSWNDGDYINAEITQIGSTIAGSDLTVHIVYS